jgi:hypothetical protein
VKDPYGLLRFSIETLYLTEQRIISLEGFGSTDPIGAVDEYHIQDVIGSIEKTGEGYLYGIVERLSR